MIRRALTDGEWQRIEPLIPGKKGDRGRHGADNRLFVDAVLWLVRAGAPWRDLPERFGSWKTVYHRFRRWQREGLFDRILERLQIRLDSEGKIDWDLWCVDGSSIRASRAAAGGGKKGAAKSPQTTLWAARKADSAASCTWLLTAEEYRLPRKSRRGSGTNRCDSNRS